MKREDDGHVIVVPEDRPQFFTWEFEDEKDLKGMRMEARQQKQEQSGD